jgi:GntR family transcriptional regulator
MSRPNIESIRLTVLKGYQELVERGWSRPDEAAACSSMPVRALCCCQGERQKFLAEEWPRITATIQRLGLKAEDLLDGAARRSKAKAKEEGAEAMRTFNFIMWRTF